jgi:hypothetical protein
MGVNTISSPTVVSFKKNVDIYFDESLVYLMDIDFYYGMREKYEDPIFYKDILVTNRFPHSHSISSNILDKEKMLSEESNYCLEKYKVKK